MAGPLFIYLAPLLIYSFIHWLNKYLNAYYTICQGYKDDQVSLSVQLTIYIQEDTKKNRWLQYG